MTLFISFLSYVLFMSGSVVGKKVTVTPGGVLRYMSYICMLGAKGCSFQSFLL